MKIFISILLVLILASCSSTKKFNEKMEEDESLPFYNKELKTLKIEASFDININDNEQSAGVEINLKRNEEIGMNIFGPFGIEVARLYANSEKMLFYNMFEGSAFQGIPSAENMEKMTNISISINDLISIMRSEIPSEKGHYALTSEKDGDKVFTKILEDELGSAVVNIDKFGVMRKYQQIDENALVTMEVEFKNYKEINGFKLAHLINVKFPHLAGSINVEVEKYTPNLELGDLNLKIPNSIKIKEIK